jgi:glycosyltransferase involved in cell wall biosynthesis
VKPLATFVAHDAGGEGGMERAIDELLPRLAPSYDMTVVSVSASDTVRAVARHHAVQIPTRPVSVKFPAFWIAGSRTLARARQGLVITLGAIVPNAVDVVWLHLSQHGLVQSTQSYAPATSSLSRRLNTGIVRTVALAAERHCLRPGRVGQIVAVSSSLAEEVRTWRQELDVVVIGNGVDTKQFAFRGERPDRSAVLPGRSRPVILFVGGDWPLKGLDIAIRALDVVVRSGIDAELWIVGRGQDGWVRRQPSFPALHDRIRFHGPQVDVEPFYAAADVLVLPSRYESYGLVLAEAASTGVPVVASPVGIAPELAVAGGAVLASTVDEVAGAVRGLILDPARAKAMGAAGRRWAERSSWDDAASRWVESLEQARAVA